ncbi:MAG: glycosyltransferase [Candidatus Omnitrophica bacterium]|nr:glycosyltransferase [Candidatus Omnitrophota bacterium]
MKFPLVSVIIPTYNREHLLVDAVESVLSQTFKDYELIVVDDGSTDGTEEIIKRKYDGKIRYFKQENQGISGARNRGIREAKGEYIAFLDSDDLWLPEKLEKQVAFLDSHPEVGLICTKLWRYAIGKESEKRLCPEYFSAEFKDLLVSNNYVPTTTVMVRKECLDQIGLFDTNLSVAEDFDLWLRFMKRFKVHCLEDVLAVHREHPQKTSLNMKKLYNGYAQFYKKVIRLYAGEIPSRSLFVKRAAAYEYLLGTEELRDGNSKSAVKHIGEALSRSLTFGTYFFNGESNFIEKAKLLLKPYAAFAVSGFKSVFGSAR